jgi:hypothetical protein
MLLCLVNDAGCEVSDGGGPVGLAVGADDVDRGALYERVVSAEAFEDLEAGEVEPV